MHDLDAGGTCAESPGYNSCGDSLFRRTSRKGPGRGFLPQQCCFPNTLNKTATWNVEGLGYKDGFSIKLEELTRWMLYADIGILCMQETHAIQSAYFLYNDFLVVLSGSEGTCRSYAGVGFLIAPHLRRSVAGFLQLSDRLASLRMRVAGGRLAL